MAAISVNGGLDRVRLVKASAQEAVRRRNQRDALLPYEGDRRSDTPSLLDFEPK